MNQNNRSFSQILIDRVWQKFNPNHQSKLLSDQAITFLLELNEQFNKNKKKENQVTYKKEQILSLITKFIQQTQSKTGYRKQSINNLSNRTFDLKDCLEIWRWMTEDINLNKLAQSYDQNLIFNQFQTSQTNQPYEFKSSANNSKSKHVYAQLSLEQQQTVVKKSYEMVYLYVHQLRIIFNHYCKFTTQNEHKRVQTFDQHKQYQQLMTMNRYMLFCRQFDIIKGFQFKKKTESIKNLSKRILMQIFKKAAINQKLLSFESFLMTLVTISLKIHDTFDPRSYIHIELFLNSLKVKYYKEFIQKLSRLQIKYTPSQFINCYKGVLKKQNFIKNSTKDLSSYRNSRFDDKSSKISQLSQFPLKLNQNIPFDQLQSSILINNNKQKIESLRTYQSVPNLIPKLQDTAIKQIQLPKQKPLITKRKPSLPVLPSPSENRFFKPIEHHNHLNSYSKYLTHSEESSSVFKNRITGYSKINELKSKPFHMGSQVNDVVSKQKFEQFLAGAKEKLVEGIRVEQNAALPNQNLFHQRNQENKKIAQINQPQKHNNESSQSHQIQLTSKVGKISNQLNSPSQQNPQAIHSNQDIAKPIKAQVNSEPLKVKKQQKKAEKNEVLLPSVFLRQPARRKKQSSQEMDITVIQKLRGKIDLQDDDELLIRHLKLEESQSQKVQTKIIKAIQSYKSNSNFDKFE